MRLSGRSWIILLATLLLVGYGMAALMSGSGNGTRGVAAAPTEASSSDQGIVEPSGTDGSDGIEIPGMQPASTETITPSAQSATAGSQTKTPSSSGGSGSNVNTGTNTGSGTTHPSLPAGHPTGQGDSKCPRPRQDSGDQ